MEKEYYFVDFKNVNDYLKVHKLLKDGLQFPWYYGANLDALWDCLTDMVNDNAVITLQNFDCLKKWDEEYAAKIFDIFVSLKHYDDDFFYDKIKIFVVEEGITKEIV
ncbi:MAG: barstar family protein [Oscillospiraceae bacterium]|nr:barstar family protein [Oscillospiraceae bacterium]